MRRAAVWISMVRPNRIQDLVLVWKTKPETSLDSAREASHTNLLLTGTTRTALVVLARARLDLDLMTFSPSTPARPKVTTMAWVRRSASQKSLDDDHPFIIKPQAIGCL